MVTASANSRAREEVHPGWPVVVEAVIQLRPDASGPVTLTGSSGPWSDAFRLECQGQGGADRASLFVPAFASEKSIELTRERSGVVVWILDAVDLESLPEGKYEIRAAVDEKKLAGAVPAGLRSNRVELIVTAKAPAASPGGAQRKCRALMSAAIWKDDFAGALAIADAHLASNPKDVAVLLLKGEVLRSQGKNVEALASFEAALAAADKEGESFAIEEAIAELRREPRAK